MTTQRTSKPETIDLPRNSFAVKAETLFSNREAARELIERDALPGDYILCEYGENGPELAYLCSIKDNTSRAFYAEHKETGEPVIFRAYFYTPSGVSYDPDSITEWAEVFDGSRRAVLPAGEVLGLYRILGRVYGILGPIIWASEPDPDARK